MNAPSKSALRSSHAQAIGWTGFLILGILGLTWGSSFILIKKTLQVFGPVQVACLRLSITAIALAPVAWRRRAAVQWARWPYYLAVGLLGTAIPAFLFAFAQRKVSSSVAGMLNTLTPLFTLVLGIVFFRAKVIWAKVLGVSIGLAGAAVLILLGQQGALSGSIWHSLLIVLATVCYGANLNVVATCFPKEDTLTLSAVSYTMVGLPALAILGFGTDFGQHLYADTQSALAGLGYATILSLGGTVIASVLFFKLVQQTSAVFSSMVAYLMPVVALGWGLLDGETLTVFHLLGIALIMTGVYLSRR